MITSVDKFLVALIGSVLFIANNYFGQDWSLPVDTVNALVAILTPVLTWLVPNREG